MIEFSLLRFVVVVRSCTSVVRGDPTRSQRTRAGATRAEHRRQTRVVLRDDASAVERRSTD